MEKYSDIIQFSRDLFLHSYEEMPFPREEIDALDPPRFIQAAITTLDFFRDGFCCRFFKVYRKNLSEVVDTDEQFFRYVIPRCLKLIDDDNFFFSFMLVAAFICELIYHLTFRRDCYRFAGVAHKCLVAVFKRRFEETFEANGGWKGLRSFCEKTSTSEDSKLKTFADIVTGGDRDYKKQVYQRIKQCDVLHCENFILTDYELLLITIDDQLAIEAEAKLEESTAKAIDTPLEVEWTMVKDDQCVKVCSRFDDVSGTVISTFVPGSEAEPPAVSGSGDDPPSFPGSDGVASSLQNSDTESAEDVKSTSDDDSSSDNDSFSDSDDDIQATDLEEIATGFFASTAVYHLHPKEYDQKKSAHVCQWCKKRCFQCAKRLFIKHRELSLKPQKFRKTKYILTSSIKSIGKLFSKSK